MVTPSKDYSVLCKLYSMQKFFSYGIHFNDLHKRILYTPLQDDGVYLSRRSSTRVV
jgi:hypothetical protein